MENKEKNKLTDILTKLQHIDYTSMIKMLKAIVYYCAPNKVKSGYKLHKNFKPKNINSINLPPELTQQYSDVDIENLVSQCYGDATVKFARNVMDKFPSKDLTNFYNNINKLEIYTKNFEHKNLVLKTNELSSYTVGTYNAIMNKIEVDTDCHTATIYHELFHMASSVYKYPVIYCGFSQKKVTPVVTNLGDAINEGYTQLLTERYFNIEKDYNSSYQFEVHIASNLEKIIGQKKMERLYLNANLLGLINELKNYTYEDEIIKFIYETDFLMEHLMDNKSHQLEQKKINDSIRYVHEFLFRVYTTKLTEQRVSKEIDKKDFYNNLTTYLSNLGCVLKIGKYEYEYLSPEKVQESLRIMLDEPNLTVSEESKTTNESASKVK